jgi:transcriptional regulator with XRE-family HTH domain
MANKRTRNFGDVIRAKLAANSELAKLVEEESFNADIAQQVYDLRLAAKLTQKELAEKVNTQQSVISRIEDADYDGHSLTMLKRIAAALNVRLKVEFYAKPVFAEATVTEFALAWASQAQWDTSMLGSAMPTCSPDESVAFMCSFDAPMDISLTNVIGVPKDKAKIKATGKSLVVL